MDCRQWIFTDISCCITRAHQTHYEQFGQLAGTVNVGEYGQVELNVVGVRDHSYGTFILLMFFFFFINQMTDDDNIMPLGGSQNFRDSSYQ